MPTKRPTNKHKVRYNLAQWTAEVRLLLQPQLYETKPLQPSPMHQNAIKISLIHSLKTILAVIQI